MCGEVRGVSGRGMCGTHDSVSSRFIYFGVNAESPMFFQFSGKIVYRNIHMYICMFDFKHSYPYVWFFLEL